MGEPHWHVLGAGAMGCLFADALHESGCPTTLVTRTATPNDHLTLVVEREESRCERRLRAVTPDHGETITHLLVTTKAYDVRLAVAGVAHLIADKGVILLLANGMGFAEQVSADWPGLDIYCGTTTEGAYRLGAQHIRHAGRGETRIGQAGTNIQPAWFDSLSRAVGNCTWDPEVEKALWMKLAVNCIINPLTALHDCQNGELTQRPELAGEVDALCGEIAQICRAQGQADVAANLMESATRVIAGTAGNRSSMLQDVSAGRRTEIDYINGYLLKVADRHGIDAPLNRALFDEVKRRGG